uniref:Uncharacterized protein n=1 Tax=viral metagenome TaxID=1070528 RepID=A0A6C0LDW9_9ZZZZ
MLQNLTKGKMVEWVVLLVALIALGLSIAAVAKPCSSNFGDTCNPCSCPTYGEDECPSGTKCNCSKTCMRKGYGSCEANGSSSGGGSGSPGLTDCEVGGRVCCDVSEDCPTAPHGKKIPVKCDFSNGCSACPNQHKGVCSDGTPPCQSEEGDDCGTTEECCAGLTCSPAGFCIKTSPTKPGHLPGGCEEQPCNSNKDCSGYNCGPCIRGMCTSKTSLTKPGGKKGTIGGGPGSLPPGLGNIGGGGDGPDGEYQGPPLPVLHKKGNTPRSPSPSPSHHRRSPSPSPGGGGGKKSSDLPLILGGVGGGLVLFIAIAFLLMKKK